MRKEYESIIIVGGASALGKETARMALDQGLRVVLVDLVRVDGEIGEDPRVTQIIGRVEDEKVIGMAFQASSGEKKLTSVVFVTSGRVELKRGGGLLRATEIQVRALFAWGSTFLKTLSDQPRMQGTFFLISSVNSELQSHSDPFYGALKAAAESLIKSLSVQANSLGKGAFLTLKLGYVKYPSVSNIAEEHPSRTAARALLGRRQLAEWGDVARAILGLHGLETQVLNGSTLTCDFGVHLLEQTHVLGEFLGLGDGQTQNLHGS